MFVAADICKAHTITDTRTTALGVETLSPINTTANQGLGSSTAVAAALPAANTVGGQDVTISSATGSDTFTLAAGATASEVATAVNAVAGTTGVTATAENSFDITINGDGTAGFDLVAGGNTINVSAAVTTTDVSALAEVLADAIASGEDIGAATTLDRYVCWRTDDQRKLAGFTHGLVRGFGSGIGPLPTLRGLGLMAFDLLPGAKSLLARQTMGLGGRVSRLARHLDLPV